MQGGVVPLQTIPHPPQLFASLGGSTQIVPHGTRFGPHMIVQRPLLHTCCFRQTMPHPPQLLGSFDGSTHFPLHRIRFGGHGSQPLPSHGAASLDESRPPSVAPRTSMSVRDPHEATATSRRR